MSVKNLFTDKVFIIGAGAHVPYGMPTSEMLTANIKGMLNINKANIENINEELLRLQRNNIVSILAGEKIRLTGSELNTLNAFIDIFSRSGLQSVDAFLSKTHVSSESEFVTIGKLLIYYLIDFYQHCTHYLPVLRYREHNWIDKFINMYLENSYYFDEFFDRPPKLHTFNYDTIFENKIYNYLLVGRGIENKEAKTMISNLNINHIYGGMDFNISRNSFFSEKNNSNYILTDFNPNSVQLSTIESSIKIIGEERGEVARVQEISNDILKAKATYVLGYGFDKINNELLFSKVMKNERPSHNIYFTNINIKESTKRMLFNEYRIYFNKFLHNYKDNRDKSHEIDCSELLFEQRPLV